MEEKVLIANHRAVSGKAGAAEIRRKNGIPAIMYDRHGKSTPLEVSELEFNKLFKTITESTILKIKIGNEEHEVFVKDFQHDIVTDKILHIDFYAVERGKLLRTKVQIKLQGSPEGARHGGILETGISEVEVECLPKDLPPRIIVDVSNLDMNESLHVKDIPVKEGVTILTDSDITVAALKFASSEIPQAAVTSETQSAETAPQA